MGKNILKKITAFFLALCFVISSGAFRQDVMANDERIEIRFTVGDSDLYINGNMVTVPTPYVVNGTTLVPLRVISEAFGAEVLWDGGERKVTITYEDKTIVLYIGSVTALVNGEEMELLEAPQIRDSTTMVPLRFITENFDATVNYDGETRGITVIKEPFGDGEASQLMSSFTKARIGDSHYNWTMDTPKDLTLSERSFDATTTHFVGDDYDLEIVVIPNFSSLTIEDAFFNAKESIKEYTVVSAEIETDKYGVRFIHLQYKTSGEFVDEMMYFKSSHLLGIITYMDSSFTVQKRNECLRYSNTFVSTYAYDPETQDISNVNADGYREYRDKDYKLSFSVPKNFYEYVSEKENSKEFSLMPTPGNKDASATLTVGVFSKTSKTLEEWAKSDYELNTQMYNPKFINASQIAPATFGSVTAVGYTYKAVFDDFNYSLMDYYMYVGDYGYNFSFSYNDDFANGKIIAETVFSTLKFEPLDPNVIGKLQAYDSVSFELTKTLTDSKMSFSIKTPESCQLDTSNSSATYCIETETGIIIAISKETTDISSSDLYDVISYGSGESDDYKISKTKIGGYSAVQINTVQYVDSIEKDAYCEFYFVIKDGKMYSIMLVSIDLYYGGSMHKAMQNAIKTIEFK